MPYLLFLKSGKIFICRLLKIIGGALRVNDIERNKGSKIYPQNQATLDCILPTEPLKHKFLSIIVIWDIVSHK